MAEPDPRFDWCVPVGILIARRGRQPNVKKVLARLQHKKKKKKKTGAGLTSDSLPAVPRLQSMFPTTEENVCALVYANSGRDFDGAVEMLSQMVGQPPRVNTSESPSSSSKPLSSASLSPQSRSFTSYDRYA